MLIKLPITDKLINPTIAVSRIISELSEDRYAGNLIVWDLRPAGQTKRHTMARFMLRVRDCHKEPARKTASGRRTNAVSWDAHRVVMEAIFGLHPEAILVTQMATYEGKADFYAKYEATYMTPVQHCGHRAAFGEL